MFAGTPNPSRASYPDQLQPFDPTGDTNERDLKLTHPLRTRSDRSKLHICLLQGLPQNPKAEAFAEAIAWADTDEIADLATVFGLADAIDFHANLAVYHSDCQFAEISADELRTEHGAPTVNLALKLAGYAPRQRGLKMAWSDAPSNEQAVPVTLPADLLKQWNSA